MTNEIFNCYWYGITRSESQSRKFPSIQDFKSPGTWAPSPLCPRPRWRCVYLEPEPLFRSVPGHRGCCVYLEPEPLFRSVPGHVGAVSTWNLSPFSALSPATWVLSRASTTSLLLRALSSLLVRIDYVSIAFLSKASDGVPGCRRLFCKVFQFVYQGLHAVISCLLQHTLKWKCGVNIHDHSWGARKIVLQYFHIWL